MKTVWFKQEHNRNPKQKKDFEEALRNSRVLIDRFMEILDKMSDEIELDETSIDFYDAGYPFKQAFRNGEKRNIQRIKDLFDFEKGNNP
jgi:hypothetical protein